MMRQYRSSSIVSRVSAWKHGPGANGVASEKGCYRQEWVNSTRLEEECCLPLARNLRLASPVRLIVPGWGPVQDKHNEYVSPFLLR
jgi:hypothetical protein